MIPNRCKWSIKFMIPNKKIILVSKICSIQLPEEEFNILNLQWINT